MYQPAPQSSRQPRHPNSNNMQQRGSQNRQAQQPQQQTPMPMSIVPPAINPTPYNAPVYQYPAYSYAMSQYPHQYVAIPAPILNQTPIALHQARYTNPMGNAPRPMQPRSHAPQQQKTRSRAIAIVDPNTMKEVNVAGESSSNPAVQEQINGEPKGKSEDSVVNGILPEKHEEGVVAAPPSENITQQQPAPQDPALPPEIQNTQAEVKSTDKRMPKPRRGPRQDSSRKSSTASPEPPRKSPETVSSISPPPPAQPVAQEPPVEEADDDGGSWQEAKPRTRSSKKKGEPRNAPERQQQPINDRQQPRRKDSDRKGARGKPSSGPSVQKAAPEKPTEANTPQPPPVISYKDRLLGKKEEKRTPEPVPTAAAPVVAAAAEKKPEEPVKVDEVVEKVVPAEVKVVAKPEKETVIAEGIVERAKEEEKKPEPELEVVSKPVAVEEVRIEKEEMQSKPEPEKLEPEIAKPEEKNEEVVEIPVVVEAYKEPLRTVPSVDVKPEAEPEVEEKPVEIEKSDLVVENLESKAEVKSEERIPAQKLYRSSSLDNLVYADDQWSPQNQAGKKKYESDFLRKLQNVSTSMKLPENVNIPKNIVREASRDARPFGAGGISFMPYGKENALMPSFANSSPRRDPRRMQDGAPKIIKSISLSADVKLNESTNAWKPTPRKPRDDDDDATETEELMKKVRSVLNKLTPEKFEKLLGQVKEMKIDTLDKLSGVIDLIFNKAIMEAGFCQMYANLCWELSTFVGLKSEEATITFSKLLIQRCQQEYEKQNASQAAEMAKMEEMQAKIQAAEGSAKKELELELAVIEQKKRKRYVGVNLFIAELYTKGLLSASIMCRCIDELLKEKNEEALECLCKIVTTIGKDLESKKRDLSAQFAQLRVLMVDKENIPTRIRFMMQDVIELKERNWVPRKETVKPKTMEEIAQEAKMEAAALPPPPSMPFGNTGNHRTPSRGHDRDRDRQNERPPNRSLNNKPVKVDFKKLALSNTNATEVSLGRPMHNWQSGSGVSRSTNQFSVLSDSSNSDMDGPNNNLPMSKQPHRL